MGNYFPTSEAVKTGWNTVLKNLLFFIGVVLLTAVLNYIPSQIANAIEKDNAGGAVVLRLISLIMGIIVSIGRINICLNFLDRGSAQFADLFSKVNLFFQYSIASILDGLIVLGGFLLLVIPGIIWAIKHQFFGYLVVDKGMGPIEAIKRSAEITNGEKWNLFIFGILLALINLAGALCLVVGLFVTIPVSWVAMAYMYRRLSGVEPSAAV